MSKSNSYFSMHPSSQVTGKYVVQWAPPGKIRLILRFMRISLVLENILIYLGVKSHTKVTYAPGIQDTNDIVYVYYTVDPYQEGEET